MLFKISCCAFNFVGLDLDEKLDLVANMAFDTVDLSAKSGDELSQAGLIEEPTEYGAFVRDRAAASGLILDELFICTILQDRADVDLTTDDDAVRQHALTAFSQFCIFGQAAGFRSILVVPLAPEGDMDEATAWDNTVKMLRNFTEIAGEHDLLFNIEPVDFSLTKTPELACKMAQDVPGMGFTLDYSHWVSVGCSQEEIETMHPFTRHMHIRQAALGSRQEPVETGTIDFARVTQRLLDDDFEGTLALEHIGKLEPGYRPVDSVVRQNAELAARLEYTARRQIKTEVLPASMEASASQRTVPGEEPSAYKPEDEAWEAISLNERRLTEGVLSRNQEKTSALLHDAFVYVRENGQVITKTTFLSEYLPNEWIDAELVPREAPRQFGDLITTAGLGYFRMKGEPGYPGTAVTHLWVRGADGNWLLAHRQESHKGHAIGPLLPQEGGVSESGLVGFQPRLDVAKEIAVKERAWLKAMVDNDSAVMEGLMHPALQYVHVTDHTSTFDDFMYELSTGFTGANFWGTAMRAFGEDVVVGLHLANYLHLGGPVQSNSQAMHCWVRFDDGWKIVSRHATRFLPY